MFEALLWGRPPCTAASFHVPPDWTGFIVPINCTLLTSGVSGFPLSFGVFQNYYSTLPQFAGNRYISVVGTVASGLSYLGAPFIMPLIKRYHKYQRHMIWIGCSCQLYKIPADDRD